MGGNDGAPRPHDPCLVHAECWAQVHRVIPETATLC